MNIFDNEVKNLRVSSTFLLYSDYRISLIDEANKFASQILGSDIYNNPDYYYYPELKMDDVRELIMRVSESSYNNRKVYIIDKIEIAKKEVLNAILKVIEEPPKNVYFILLTRRMDILETIKSRSIKLDLTRNIPKDLIDENYDIYKFFEYDFNYLNEYISGEIDIDTFNVESLEEVYENIFNYYQDSNLENRIKYEKSIIYILKSLKYEKEIQLVNLSDKIIKILIDKDLKSSREKVYSFMYSCILKCVDIYNINKIEKLLEYKNSIKSNVNLKLSVFLFLNSIFEI
jgi:DNA polymerase III gamma/tau subunits-like protein